MRTDSVTERDPWIDRLDASAWCSDAHLAGALERLASKPAVSTRVLSGPVLGELTAAAGLLPFRPAESQAGKPEARVYQQFGYCGVVPDDHPVRHLGRWFEMRVRGALASMPAPPIPIGFTINDVVCQRYRPGELGITPHRDHVSYTQLIVLVVLSGRGRYFTCSDRRGSNKLEIESAPGWAILMPGPGYAGRSDRPFHMVDQICELRYSVGLRHDERTDR